MSVKRIPEQFSSNIHDISASEVNVLLNHKNLGKVTQRSTDTLLADFIEGDDDEERLWTYLGVDPETTTAYELGETVALHYEDIDSARTKFLYYECGIADEYDDSIKQEVVEYHIEDFYSQYDYALELATTVTSVRDIVTELQDQIYAGNIAELTDDQRWIFDTYKEFYYGADSVGYPADNVRAWLNFIAYVDARTDQIIHDGGLIESAEKVRENLANNVGGDNFKVQLGLDIEDDIAEVIRQTPIILMDPLTARIEYDDYAQDLGGYFSVLRGEAVIFLHDRMTEKEFEDAVTGQLIRSIMGFGYNMKIKDSIEIMKYHRYYPNFFIAGISDKLQNNVQDNNEEGEGIQRTPLQKYSVWESLKMLAELDQPQTNDDQVIETELTIPSTEENSRPNSTQRQLVDVVFAKADWKKAHTTAEKAERLATRAIIDSSVKNPVTTDRNANRKEFIKTLSDATQKGLLVKLGKLVTEFGPELVLDYISCPEVDLSDPESLVNLPSPARMQILRGHERRLDSLNRHLDHLIKLGVHDSRIASTEENIEISQANIHELNEIRARNAKIRAGMKLFVSISKL